MDSNIRRNILLIGAGQLGSRHLQGLLRLNGQHAIYVVEPATESIILAKKRAEEIKHSHKLNFVTDWATVPKTLDLSIIATSANIRKDIVSKLLINYEVRYLILEKILFQEVEAYNEISQLISTKGVRTWVNHPRRMMKLYRVLKKELKKNNSTIMFNVVGGNWGLACNALHFLDLFSYLTNSEIETIEMNWVDDVIHKSKRANYVEFTGTLKGTLKNNSHFSITSFQGNPEPVTIYISTPVDRWTVQEASDAVTICISKQHNYKMKIENYTMDFQSTLTANLVNDIFQSGNCELPSYEEACKAHLPFIEAVLEKYNKITGQQTNACPIT